MTSSGAREVEHPTRLDAADRDSVMQAALDHLLTGVHPFAGDPFQRRVGLEVVGEEWSPWTEDFPRRLQRATGRPSVIALRSSRGDDDRLVVTDGWELPLASEQDTWWNRAGDADLVHNGLEFVVLDRTASWAILVLLDVQLVGGDDEFTRAYFGGDLGKEEATEIFLSTVGNPDGYDEFRQLADYIRPAPKR